MTPLIISLSIHGLMIIYFAISAARVRDKISHTWLLYGKLKRTSQSLHEIGESDRRMLNSMLVLLIVGIVLTVAAAGATILFYFRSDILFLTQ